MDDSEMKDDDLDLDGDMDDMEVNPKKKPLGDDELGDDDVESLDALEDEELDEDEDEDEM